MIQIRLDDEKALRSLSQIAQNLQQGKKLHGMLGEALRHIHRERFKSETAPDGKKWKSLHPVTLASKRGKCILRESGQLANTLAYQATENSVVFGSNLPYARLHQFGGVIKPKQKKILKTKGGVFLRQANIPARPWLGVSKQNEDYLLAKTEHFIRRVIQTA